MLGWSGRRPSASTAFRARASTLAALGSRLDRFELPVLDIDKPLKKMRPAGVDFSDHGRAL